MTFVQVSNKLGTAESKAVVAVKAPSEEDVTTEDTSASEVGTPAPQSPTEERSSKKKDKAKKEKAPKISSELTDLEAVEGEEVKFKCKVKGSPPPEVEWLRDGKKIAPSDVFTMTSDGDVHTLLIKKVTLDFVGTYTIKVRRRDVHRT